MTTPLALVPGQQVRIKGKRKAVGVFKGWRIEKRQVAHVLTPDGKNHFLMPDRIEVQR